MIVSNCISFPFLNKKEQLPTDGKLLLFMFNYFLPIAEISLNLNVHYKSA